MKKTYKEIIESSEFKSLVGKKTVVSVILTILLFINYYGFIFSIALNKQMLSQKIGQATTLGIPIAVGVILVSWALVAIYIVWANNTYDPEIKRMKSEILGK